MGKWVHRLSEINEVERKAVCANCGPVPVVWSHRWVCQVARRSLHRPPTPEQRRWARVKQTYGLTRDEWHRIWERQNGKCAICIRKKRLVVDHDHKTGRVRGLLCNSCNRGLGFFFDRPTWLRRAASYLGG